MTATCTRQEEISLSLSLSLSFFLSLSSSFSFSSFFSSSLFLSSSCSSVRTYHDGAADDGLGADEAQHLVGDLELGRAGIGGHNVAQVTSVAAPPHQERIERSEARHCVRGNTESW